MNFGNLSVKSTSTQTVTLLNTGDVNVSVSGLTVVGSGFGYSDLSPGFSLAPNQKVVFQIWFRPQVKGPATGKLSIISANISSPTTIELSGDGTSGSNPPPTQPPPSNSQKVVHLTWKASPSSVVGYRLYRSDASGTAYTPLTAMLDSLSFDDSSVDSGATYYYVVTAVDAAGEESTYSNQATAVIPST
jgi:hypothetical protein